MKTYCFIRIATILAFVQPAGISAPVEYYVSPAGNDLNQGTFDSPWKTIQKAANSAIPGSTVFVRGGTYPEAVTVNVSGNALSGNITFRNYPGELPVVDGTSLTVPASYNALFLLVDKSYIAIEGFELRNYRTTVKNRVPIAILIAGSGSNFILRNNYIHHIEHNGTSSSGTDAHGIAAYGTSGTVSLKNLLIEGNTLADLKLGSSEALVVNGNVEQFSIIGNAVYHCNNIAIDAIGFEGTAPANDQARFGLIAQKVVGFIDSYGNPAYGTDRSADGIYIDGGRNIVIERNIVHHSNIGIELASEHSGKATTDVTMRNNFIYLCGIAGIAIGGYDVNRGRTENCRILNNTLFQNDSLLQGKGEFMIQYDVRNTIIKNNLVYANAQGIMMTNDYTANSGNYVDYNLYFSPKGAANCTWQWKKISYQGFSAYRSGSGNDAHAQFADPLIDVAKRDYHLKPNSPAVNAGIHDDSVGLFDIDGSTRIVGIIDIGADEYQSGTNMRDAAVRRNGAAVSVYPNPCNPSVTFRTSAPAFGEGTLIIYDQLANVVQTRSFQSFAGESKPLTVDTRQLASGIYYYSLSVGKLAASGKFSILK